VTDPNYDPSQTPQSPYSATPNPYAAPQYPSAPTPPTYSAPPGYPAAPAQPSGYPVSSAPTSAYPTSAYPASSYPAPAPAAPKKTGAMTWVLGAISIVLLLTSGGMGYAFFNARSEVVDRNDRITELQRSVADKDEAIEQRDAELTEAKDDLETAEADLAGEQACHDALLAFWLAPSDDFETELNEMIDTCNLPS
jgi:hypothetical protein